MNLGSEDIRAAVVRQHRREAKAKRKADAAARRAEAGAGRAEAGGVQRAEASSRRAEADEAPGAGANEEVAEAKKARKKKAVVKTKRPAEAGTSAPKKRPRSRSPPTQTAPEPEPVTGPFIDLAVDTPPEEPRVEVQPSPPPVIPEAEPDLPATRSPSGGDLLVGEPGAEEGPREAEQSGPAAATAGEDFSLRSVAGRGRWAEEVVSRSRLPEMETDLLSRGSNSFFQDAFSAQLWMINSLFSMRDVFVQAEASTSGARDEVAAARARAEEAEGAMRAAQAAEAEATARAERAKLCLEATRHQAVVAAKASEEALLKNQQETKREIELMEEKLKKMEAELFSREQELHTVSIQVQGAEERAENAEEVARNSDARVLVMEQEVLKAKQEATEAKSRAADAVTFYRQSPANKRDLADAAAFSYKVGFQDCKLKVQQIFKLDGVEDVEPDCLLDVSSSSSSDEDTAPAES